MANEPATQESTVKYEIEGREVTLTPSLIRKYVVRGHGELTSGQEIAFFMGLCRARRLDPLAGDVFIIKYAANDPAAIVISIDAVRARAKMQPDNQGWRCGVIVKDTDGKIKDTAGLVLEGETLLGGWAECTPKGWPQPMRLEANLKAYIKKKTGGEVTKFWQPDQQPMMITKIAEMQLLRRIWPAALGKLYLAEEVGRGTEDGETMDMIPDGPGGQYQEETPEQKFNSLIETENFSHVELEGFNAYVQAIADHSKTNITAVKAKAMTDFTKFVSMFRAWAQKRREKAEIESKTKAAAKDKAKIKEPAPVETAAQDPAQEGPFPPEVVNPETGEVTDPRPDSVMIPCPQDDGANQALGFCRENCVANQDCTAWKV